MLLGLFVANLWLGFVGCCFLSLQVGHANVRGADYHDRLLFFGSYWPWIDDNRQLADAPACCSVLMIFTDFSWPCWACGDELELMASARPVEECNGFCCWGRGPVWMWLVGALFSADCSFQLVVYVC
ncbi:hypothetical protein Nepgr_016430 [Nepenthes gracilis]|uniref:Secreted protein n=1 Tax=Nepenthes gracilis TaxID=150966 RepID=A0AAD3SPQ7_NEPGR|nr:hypothetical protein Nepgr_016430 [Nepenthes gracilis]